MQLKLNRPIVFFDLETTGIDTSKDRIVEISLVKLTSDGKREIKTRRLNPTIPIPKQASDVHGITDDMVVDEPTFAQIARSLETWIAGCDLAGYNSNRFDIPLLHEEFYRAGIKLDLEGVNMVDVQSIFHKMEPRTLTAAYQYYCGKSLENAHSAQADTEATLDILLAQVERYPELAKSVPELAAFSRMTNNMDLAGRVVFNENDVPVFNFGKFKGEVVADVFAKQPSYYAWIMNGDFPQNTKDVVTKIRLQAVNMK